MTQLFNAIGEMFEAIFPLLTAMGRGANALFIVLGFIGTMIWLLWGTKYKSPNS